MVTRADVRIISNSGVVCQHISSLYVWNGLGGTEFGYLIGYSNCPGYTNTFYTIPRPFYWAYSSQGSFIYCRVWTGTSLTQNSYSKFRTSDTNADFRWGPWLDSTELLPGSQGILLDFNKGMTGFGMERGDAGDPGYSRNNQLAEYRDANGWTPWDQMEANTPPASDPLYKFQSWSVTEGGSVLK